MSRFTMKRFRTIFQVTILALVLITGLRHAAGWSRTTIETYCPFGGLATVFSLFTEKQFTCATGERNLTMFLALVALTLLARKSFCGWVCPVGTISEWFITLGKRLFPHKRENSHGRTRHALEPSPAVDRSLRWLRVVMLGTVLLITFKTGELLFRKVDPYYILFSIHGHDVVFWSYIVLAAILVGILILPMAWCRYLCPLGAALTPFSSIGRLRITREEATCTHCRICEDKCPHSIVISATEQVTSGDCTLCFECVEACPVEDTLGLEIRGWKK